MLRQKLLLVERSKSTHSVQEGGKGGIVDNVSHLISSICIILQYVFIAERPLKNLYSYLNNPLIVQELDINHSHFTEQFY